MQDHGAPDDLLVEDELEDESLEELSSAPQLEVEGDTLVSRHRAAIVEIAEESSEPIERIIERVLELLAEEHSGLGASEHEYTDDLLSAPPAVSVSVDLASLRRRLSEATTCPWPVRQGHAREKLPRWQRLRLLDALGCLRRCWCREGGEQRRCTLSDKRHRGCGRRGIYGPDACQMGQLLHLSQEIGGLAFYAQFRPSLSEDGKPVEPPEWPNGSSPHARKMTAALWALFRDRTHGQNDDLQGRVRSMKRGRAERSPMPLIPMAAAACAQGASDPTVGPAECGDHAPPYPLYPTGTWAAAPYHAADTTSQNEDLDVRPHTVTARLAVSLVARRAELTDHGLYVCHLLTRPDLTKARNARERQEQADGWRALTMALLRRDLGQVRVNGEKVERAAFLLGTRESPGLLEREGIIERRSDYSAGGKGGYSQRYRLAPALTTEPTAEVDLVLRQRTTSLPRPAKPSGPPVHPWLVSSYRELTLDSAGAVRSLCRLWDLPPVSTVGELLALLDEKPGAPQVCKERRAKVRTLEQWEAESAARRHKLRRDATVWRLHSPLTELPSSARMHLRLAGERVAALDIRACGLALRAAQMRAEGADADPDVAAVCDLIEDPTRDPYVEFFTLVHGRSPGSDERDQFKHTLLAELWFAGIDAQLRSEVGRAVRARYPGLHAYLLRAKREVGHAELANATMRLESTLIIDRLADRLAAAEVWVVTVHDCVYVRDTDTERARVLFASVLRDSGVRAALTVTRPDEG